MTEGYFEKLLGYKAAMAQVRIMLSQGLIASEEYPIIETKMAEHFGINYGNLYRENEWTCTNSRGNMSPIKEVI